eukprot:6067817-Pyramimonas_sp.AAC.1
MSCEARETKQRSMVLSAWLATARRAVAIAVISSISLKRFFQKSGWYWYLLASTVVESIGDNKLLRGCAEIL